MRVCVIDYKKSMETNYFQTSYTQHPYTSNSVDVGVCVCVQGSENIHHHAPVKNLSLPKRRVSQRK